MGLLAEYQRAFAIFNLLKGEQPLIVSKWSTIFDYFIKSFTRRAGYALLFLRKAFYYLQGEQP